MQSFIYLVVDLILAMTYVVSRGAVRSAASFYMQHAYGGWFANSGHFSPLFCHFQITIIAYSEDAAFTSIKAALEPADDGSGSVDDMDGAISDSGSLSYWSWQYILPL